MGFGSLAVTVTKGKGKEKEKAEVVGKKQGRAREISENSLVKELVPRKKRNNLVLLPSPDPVKIRPAVSEQPAAGSGPAIEPLLLSPLLLRPTPETALKRLRAADAEFEEVQ